MGSASANDAWWRGDAVTVTVTLDQGAYLVKRSYLHEIFQLYSNNSTFGERASWFRWFAQVRCFGYFGGNDFSFLPSHFQALLRAKPFTSKSTLTHQCFKDISTDSMFPDQFSRDVFNNTNVVTCLYITISVSGIRCIGFSGTWLIIHVAIPLY